MLLIAKRLVVFLPMLFSLLTGICQNVQEGLKPFIKCKEDSTPVFFYQIQLIDNAPLELKNKLTLQGRRILSDSTFIIDRYFLQQHKEAHSYIKNVLPMNDYWKLSPALLKLKGDVSFNRNTTYTFNLLISDGVSLKNIERINKHSKNMAVVLVDQNIFSVKLSYVQLDSIFLHDSSVVYIDIDLLKAKGELGTPGYDLSANKINVVHHDYPAINGAGQHVSIKEDYYDTTDIDLKGRMLASPGASSNISNHANFTATIIAGAGNSVYYARGAAPAASISSVSYASIFPDTDSIYRQQNITVQNHSYGTVSENEYGLNAVAFDKSAGSNPDLLHVFSSGNIGTSASSTGNYAGIDSFANLTGNFKMAKNVLVVGAVDSFGNVVPLSSRGPAYDGRIKPDLVAFQQNGTSEAAALVSGTALLLQQYYKQQLQQNALPAALAKAILINTADDVDAPGPDYKAGFGNLNAIKAMNLLRDNNIFSGQVANAAAQTFSVKVPANVSLLKITLAWNDTAATPLANKALINDLDLEVSFAPTNQSWKPWVLNSAANNDSLNSIAVRKRDSLNNVEQVTIANAAAGDYLIKVSGFNLPSGLQKFHVVFGWDSANYFRWERPLSNSFIEAGTQTILRWQNSFNNTGLVEYSFPGLNNWLAINPFTTLTNNYIYWNTPDTNAQALVRMKIGNTYYYSDTFLVSSLVKPTTGLICGDSVFIYWNKIKNIQSYQVYQLGPKYMEPLMVTSDTFAFINKNTLNDKFLAVAPLPANGLAGQKSYAFNYNSQGAGCYINSFYVDKNGAEAVLNLLLGTVINVENISFEINTGNGYTQIDNSIAVNSQLQFSKSYRPLKPGITYFRAKLILKNGQVIYTNPEAVFYTTPGKYVLLPMPVARGNDITILADLPDGEMISVIDELGRILLTQTIQSSRQLVKTSRLPRGYYFYRITKNGSVLQTGKLLIL